MSHKSFYVVRNTNKFPFNTINELKDYADEENQDMESFEIRLGDHCPDLTDLEFDTLSKMDRISLEDIKLLEDIRLGE